jgi:signal transduction histidine kinase
VAEGPVSNIYPQDLSLESTLQQLSLYNFHIQNSRICQEVAQNFEANPLLPGVILIEDGQFAGMISRWRFFEQLSRPFGIDIFLKRPIKSLQRLAGSETLILPGDTLIVAAAKQSLQRPPKLLYEPIVVELEPGVYQLADIHQLLVAQSQIHELTTHLLDEQTRAKMMQSEKMASLGRMLAGVAHEIRNPVNSICGNLDFLTTYWKNLINLVLAYEEEVVHPSPRLVGLKEEIELDFLIEDLEKIMKSMKMGGDRLTKLVAGLRNFSHMDELNRQPIDIHECIDSTLVILSNPLKQGIKVIKDYGDLPPINCYSGQMSQVFINIISNAIDALEETKGKNKNGSIVAFKEEDIRGDLLPTIWISTYILDSHDAVIRIADNGPGIPPEIQARIFDTFFTTKPVGKGTGLGLAICHEIVTQKHGGQLLMRSRGLCSGQSCSLYPGDSRSVSRGELRSASETQLSRDSEAVFQGDVGTEFEIRLPLV